MAKSGDKDAFSEIVEKLQQKVFRFCYPMLGNRQDAEDTVQDVFIRAYGSLKQYEEGGRFTGWIFTIAHRLCLNKLKKRSRFLAFMKRFAYEEASRERKRDQTDVWNEETISMLKGLNPKLRGLVILRILHEMSYEEIGVVLGVAPVNLRKQYERARKQLRENRGPGETWIKDREGREKHEH